MGRFLARGTAQDLSDGRARERVPCIRTGFRGNGFGDRLPATRESDVQAGW